MKLMPARRSAGCAEYAVAREFHCPIPQGQIRLLHDGFSRKKPDHLMRYGSEIADGLREIHHPAAFRIDRSTPLSELSNCGSHAGIISQFLAMQFRIAPA